MCTMTISRGNVVLVLFPDANLRTAKRRPALVVQADALQTGLPQVIVSMIAGDMGPRWTSQPVDHCCVLQPRGNRWDCGPTRW